MLSNERKKENKKIRKKLPFLRNSSNKCIHFGGAINLAIWLHKKLFYLFYHLLLQNTQHQLFYFSFQHNKIILVLSHALRACDEVFFLVVLFCSKKKKKEKKFVFLFYTYNFYFENLIYKWVKKFENQLKSDPIF